jgi:hypothetical protein
MRWTASALKLCGYANVLGAKRKRSKGQREAMGRGTDFHECIKLGSQSENPIVQGWLDVAYRAMKLPDDVELERALGLSRDGRYVHVDETEPHVYVQSDGGAVMLTAGRADAVWMDAATVYLGDFKTGTSHLGPPEQLPQLAALGFAAADLHGAESMRLGIYYARDGQWDWSEVIPLDSPKAAELWDMVVACATADESPRPGPHCFSCFERKACEHAA